jgi:hypothetical protein
VGPFMSARGRRSAAHSAPCGGAFAATVTNSRGSRRSSGTCSTCRSEP